jgi:hypothetical protein
MIDVAYSVNDLIGLLGNAAAVVYQAIAALTDWFFSISGHLMSGFSSWLGSSSAK